MDFQLQSLTVEQAAQLPVDALLVLVPDTFTKPGKTAGKTAGKGASALTELMAEAGRRGDLDTGAGKCLACYRPVGIKATRVVLAGVGDGSAASVRKAVTAGWAGLKLPQVKKVALMFGLMEADNMAVQAAIISCADASYVFTHTKPSAKARTLQQVMWA